MIPAKNKLEEVHIHFWGFHNSSLLLESFYASILQYEKLRKIWVLYFCSKDEFIDAFKI